MKKAIPLILSFGLLLITFISKTNIQQEYDTTVPEHLQDLEKISPNIEIQTKSGPIKLKDYNKKLREEAKSTAKEKEGEKMSGWKFFAIFWGITVAGSILYLGLIWINDWMIRNDIKKSKQKKEKKEIKVSKDYNANNYCKNEKA